MDDVWSGEELMNQLSEREQLSCMDRFCSGLIQADGLDRAIGYYQRLEVEGGETESKVAAAARYRIHNRIKQASQNHEGVSVFVDQVAELHRIRPFEVGNFANMSQLWRGDAGLGNRLEFLESVGSQFGFRGEELQKMIVASGVTEFEGFEQWMQEHPNSTILEDLKFAQTRLAVRE